MLLSGTAFAHSFVQGEMPSPAFFQSYRRGGGATPGSVGMTSTSACASQAPIGTKATNPGETNVG
jgi:hypothetical protein